MHGVNKVKAGFFALAEVTKGHVEWNWWHSSDHIPENVAIDGIVLGERWAAPKKYRDARLAAHPAWAGSQYLIYYLFTDPVERVIRDFSDLGARVTHMGRMYQDRTIPLAGHYDLVRGCVASRIEVPPEALPYRPNRGVFCAIADLSDPAKRDEITRWYDTVHIPDMLTVKGVGGCYWFRSRGNHFAMSPGLGDPANWHVFLYYLDVDPLETVADLKAKLPGWKAAGRLMDAGKSATTLLAAPFVTIANPRHYDCD